jgi:G:T-mismatch repair DNA endonuclease (very short patch repair protein)
MVILEKETFEKFGYYPRDLTSHSGKKIIAACDDCGKIREPSRQMYRSLCFSCSRRLQKGKKAPGYGKFPSAETRKKMSIANRGEKHYLYGKHLPEETRRKIGIAGKGRHPSEETRKKIGASRKGDKHPMFGRCGKNNPNWKGGRVECICKECGRKIYIQHDQIKRGRGKFCSRSCRGKAVIRTVRGKTKPQKTNPELTFEGICKKYSLPFHFVGDGSLWIGNANPDFIHNSRKLCVEIFGNYWHSPLLNGNIKYKHTLEGRRKQLKREGYKLLVFWESDLKRKDAAQFVLYTLKKNKVM